MREKLAHADVIAGGDGKFRRMRALMKGSLNVMASLNMNRYIQAYCVEVRSPSWRQYLLVDHVTIIGSTY
jgi:hypothetical protein